MRSLSALIISCLLACALAQTFQWRRVARDLRNPRHLAFGKGSDDHHLYIAEAGLGSNATVEESMVCRTSPEDPSTNTCFGLTGSITRVDLRTSTQRRVVDGLPSLANAPVNASDESVRLGSFAVGPNSVSTASRFCEAQLGKEEQENLDGPFNFELSNDEESARATTRVAPLLFGVTTCGDTDTVDALRRADADLSAFGKLLQFHEQLDGSFTWTATADLCRFEFDNDPDGQGGDSDPYDLISLRHPHSGDIYHLVADAAGNDVLAVDQSTGQIKPIAVFPNRSGRFGNATVTYQSVPTCLTRSGNSVFVGELTGAPFIPGAARVLQLTPGAGGWSVFASSFTNVVSVTHDADGNLYVLELLAKGLSVGAGGQDFRAGLLKIKADGSVSRLLPCRPGNNRCEDLQFGGGLQYRNKTLYVSHKAVFDGGEVVAIPVSDLPEYDPDLFTV